jgi:SAM-dependent methyltransferase
MNRKKHWENTYGTRRVRDLSWYEETPARSLSMIRRANVGLGSPVIDVGGGASLLAACLLDEGYEDITVLDFSGTALDKARRRLADRAAQIEWIEQDIISFVPDRTYALWHDRAVFHFLTGEVDRKSYVHTLCQALQEGGQAIISTFAVGGPQKCSGLDVVQYDAVRLGEELGGEFRLLDEEQENHLTPAGRHQLFGYFRFVRDQEAHGDSKKPFNSDQNDLDEGSG